MGREQGLAGALRGSSLLHQNQLDRYNHFVTNTEEEEGEGVISISCRRVLNWKPLVSFKDRNIQQQQVSESLSVITAFDLALGLSKRICKFYVLHHIVQL